MITVLRMMVGESRTLASVMTSRSSSLEHLLSQNIDALFRTLKSVLVTISKYSSFIVILINASLATAERIINLPKNSLQSTSCPVHSTTRPGTFLCLVTGYRCGLLASGLRDHLPASLQAKYHTTSFWFSLLCLI